MDTARCSAMEGQAQIVMKQMVIKPAHLQLMIIMAGFLFMVLSIGKPISDFGNYYYGAKLAAEKKNVQDEVYNVMQFNTNVALAGETDFFLNHNTVPPQSMLLYYPLTWLGSAATAKIIFNFLSLLLFVFILGRFWKQFSFTSHWAVAVVCVAALIPVYYNMLFGQAYLLIAALIMETILQAEKRPWLAGLFLSLAISLKLSPAIFLLFFIGERRFKVVIWTAGYWIFTAWLTGIVFLYGAAVMIHFYSHSLPRIMDGFVSDPYSSSSQGFIVFLRKLCSPDAVLYPGTLVNGSERLCHFVNVLFVLLLSFFLAGAWKNQLSVSKKFLLLLLFINITSGYTSTYSLVLLLPFLSFDNTKREWIKVMLYAAVFLFPPRIFDGYSAFLEEYKLWMFIALFFMEVMPSFSFRKIEKAQAITIGILTVMTIFRFTQRPEQLPLRYYKPAQVNADYVLGMYEEGGALFCMVPENNGFVKRQVELPDSTWMGGSVSLGTFMLGNVEMEKFGTYGDSMLVLADYHRGPGLRHLYSISKRDYDRYWNP